MLGVVLAELLVSLLRGNMLLQVVSDYMKRPKVCMLII